MHLPTLQPEMQVKVFMKKPVYFALAILLTACGSNNTEQPAQQEASPKSSISLLYESKCAICHGKDGNMGAGGAKKLSESTLDKAAVTLQITKGKGAMPAFESQLSAEEISGLSDYVIGLRP